MTTNIVNITIHFILILLRYFYLWKHLIFIFFDCYLKIIPLYLFLVRIEHKLVYYKEILKYLYSCFEFIELNKIKKVFITAWILLKTILLKPNQTIVEEYI